MSEKTEREQALLTAQRCPLRIDLSANDGCCCWGVFLEDFAEAWHRWFDAPPSPQQWRMAAKDWRSGNTGWEAAHNAQSRVKDRVLKRQSESWAASGAVLTTAKRRAASIAEQAREQDGKGE